jgi:hypothetical protein
VFDTEIDLVNHWETTAKHNVCVKCSIGKPTARDFGSEAARRSHTQDHKNHWYCKGCKIDYDTEAAREEHYQTNCLIHGGNKRKRDVTEKQDRVKRDRPGTVWCLRCDLEFQSATALEEHKRASDRHIRCKEGCEQDLDGIDEHRKVRVLEIVGNHVNRT